MNNDKKSQEVEAAVEVISSKEARKMKIAELQEYAQKVGVSTTKTVEEKEVPLTKLFLLERVLEFIRKNKKNSTASITLTEEQQKIVDDANSTASTKIRTLHDEGLSTAQIAKILGKHYSFCHSTISRYKAAKEAGRTIGERTKKEVKQANEKKSAETDKAPIEEKKESADKTPKDNAPETPKVEKKTKARKSTRKTTKKK